MSDVKLIVLVDGMPMPKTGTTLAQLKLIDKGCAIKGLVFCNGWNLELLDLLNGFALDCYQPFIEVCKYVSTMYKYYWKIK